MSITRYITARETSGKLNPTDFISWEKDLAYLEIDPSGGVKIVDHQNVYGLPEVKAFVEYLELAGANAILLSREDDGEVWMKGLALSDSSEEEIQGYKASLCADPRTELKAEIRRLQSRIKELSEKL